MAELLSPQVSIEERTSQVQQIQAVSTSNKATAGYTLRGPEDEAVLLTSIDQFLRQFGGFTLDSNVHYGVVGFFNNGGTRCYFKRITPSDAVLAQGLLSVNYRMKASSKGAWGNNLRGILRGNDNFYNNETATFSRFDFDVLEESSDGVGDFAVVETFDELDLTNTSSENYILDVVNDEFEGSELGVLEAVSGGIPDALQSTLYQNESVGTGDDSTQLFTHTVANPEVAIDTLKIKVSGTLVGIDDGEGNLEEVSGSGVTGAIDYETGSLSIFFSSAPSGGSAITIDYYKAPADSVTVDLTGGSNGTPANIGRNQISATSLQSTKQGIYSFDVIDEFLNMGIPDFSDDPTISGDLITYAETRKDVFVVLDCGAGKTALQAKRYKQVTLGSLSEYAAIYWPRIRVADELNNGRPRVISPVGHIIGCYARTDIERNVGKSPGGVDDGQLRGIIDLEVKTTQGDRDIVYPAGVNPLREDSQVGKAIWGVRTLAITGDFTRINARRLFIFLEKSFFNSTHDLVFENIGPQLWQRIKLRSDGFLTVLFEDGYFKGENPESAFRVVVDESNNPTSVQNARTVIVDYFISVNEPNELLRLRFQRTFPTT